MCCFTLVTNKILSKLLQKQDGVCSSINESRKKLYWAYLLKYFTNLYDSIVSNSFWWLDLFHCFRMASAYDVIRPTKKFFKLRHFYDLIFVTMTVELGRLLEMFTFLFIISHPFIFEQNRVGQLVQLKVLQNDINITLYATLLS